MTDRTEIRQAVADTIANLFQRCEPFRPHWVEPSDLPAAFVYLDSGTPKITHSQGYDYDSILFIELMAHGYTDLEAELDAFEQQVNQRLEADMTIGGVLEGLVRSDFQYERDPDTAVTSLTLSYQISYEE